MKKLNNRGFAHAGLLLLILVVIAAISGVGYYVWHNQNKTDTASSIQTSTTATQQPSNTDSTKLSEYQDDYVSFSYPSDWKVNREYTFTDNYGAYLLNITAPVDTNLKASDATVTKLYLQSSILIAKNDEFGGESQNCRMDCNVYHIDKVSPKAPSSEGSLVISDWGGQGYPQYIEYTHTNVAVGDKTYDLGLVINSSYFARIDGIYMSGTFSGVQLASDTDLQNSKAYKQLKELISTITFKTNKLP